MIPDATPTSQCRLCGVGYPRESWQLDTHRKHIVIQFDTECCRNCRRAFWRGVGITGSGWLAAETIWWGLRTLSVIE